MKHLIKFIILICVCISFFNPFNTHNYQTQAKNENKPMMAIVIDDYGSYDQSGVKLLARCTEPLTCAVLPNTENSEFHANLMHDLGHEIILHMPMEAYVHLPEDWYGPIYIKNSDSPETATQKLKHCLEKFPNVKGFNIHIGSGVSQNQSLMESIYNYANTHDLFFLDSRTVETHATEEACKLTKSTYLGRDVFLEADKNRTYDGVRKRLLEGAEIAKQKGYSIVIGHVGAEGGENTAKAILDTMKTINDMNVQIVPLSKIYEYIKTKN